MVEDEEVERALGQLRDRAARYDPVEGRGVEAGDTVVVDLTRTPVGADGAPSGEGETHTGVSVEIGSPANPPGFDDALVGLAVDAQKSFRLTYPADYAVQELAGTTIDYAVTMKAIRLRIVPALDDDFAKGMGDFADLDALRERVKEDWRRRRSTRRSGSCAATC